MIGSAGGFFVAFALTPVLSRLFQPEMFGTFSTLVAIASTFVGFSTLRFEVIAQRKSIDSEYWSGIGAALSAVAAISLLLAISSVVAVVVFDSDTWLLWTAPMVVLGSLQLVGGAVYTRNRKYRHLAAANFFQQAGTAVVQVAIGLWSAAIGALIAGFLAARSIWLLPLGKIRGGEGRLAIRAYWRNHWVNGAQAGTSALINSASGQLVVLLVAALHGAAVVGTVAMAVRIVVAPLGLISQAVAAAVVGEVGKLAREGRQLEARQLVRTGARDNFLIAIFPLAIAAVFAPFVAEPLLGAEWRDVGIAISALAGGALFQFIASPFSQVLNIIDRSGRLLVWDVTRLTAYAASLAVPAAFGMSWLAALIMYSLAQVIIYLLLLWMVIGELSTSHLGGTQEV
ncbi:oligosaccharide flippase family protein [Dietzia sp. 111N12-1]|uniref:oligosaccharide flippase family protein n=1 Tax=Dietzia sp. 111N12-1 TaxID=1785156 RepID=UPI000B015C15|nr:oligosaccharide flippase family protein [Dietzia sp. 111N12-1]